MTIIMRESHRKAHPQPFGRFFSASRHRLSFSLPSPCSSSLPYRYVFFFFFSEGMDSQSLFSDSLSRGVLKEVNVRHISKFLGTFRQYPLCLRSYYDEKCFYSPILSSCVLSYPKKKVRRRFIVLANDSKNAAAGTSSSESVASETTTTIDQLSSSSTDQSQVNGKEEAPPQKPNTVPNRAPLTVREKLRAARVLSNFTESKPSKPAMGSRILDALREADKGKRRSGLPEAPTNLFDDGNRGLQKEGWKFQLPGGNDLLIIAFSFVFITTVMFGTTYIVWKAGAIHFNEF